MRSGPGLAEDVAAVRQVLTASDEPTVVVAHSYGGIVTAEAAAGVDGRAPSAARIQLPARGRAEPLLVRRRGARPVPRHRPRGRHLHRPTGALAETFLQDCDPEIQREATDKTARQSLAVLEQPVRSAAWQHVPSTYLVCAEDRGTPADVAARVRRSGGQRRGTRRRPPPLPLPARRRPRPDPRHRSIAVARRCVEHADDLKPSRLALRVLEQGIPRWRMTARDAGFERSVVAISRFAWSVAKSACRPASWRCGAAPGSAASGR